MTVVGRFYSSEQAYLYALLVDSLRWAVRFAPPPVAGSKMGKSLCVICGRVNNAPAGWLCDVCRQDTGLPVVAPWEDWATLTDPRG